MALNNILTGRVSSARVHVVRKLIYTLAVLVLSAAFAAAAAAQAPPRPTLNASDLSAYQSAFEAVDRGDWATAFQRIAGVDEALPAKAIRWLYFLDSGSGATFEEITQFIADNPSWPRMDRLRLRAEQAMTRSMQPRAVLRWFEANPPQTGNGFLLYADALMEFDQSERVRQEAIRVWRDVNMSASEEDAFRRNYRLLVPMEDEIYRLDRLIWEEQWQAASRQMRRVPDAYRQLADARIRLARRSGGVDPAIARVPPDLRDHPGLVFERARWRRRAGNSAGAIELLDRPQMQVDFPEPWQHERQILARDALEDGDPELAYRLASQHRVPSGAGFADAEWFSGWVALRFLNDPERAFPHFRDMYNNVSYPVSRSRAAYWAGRAAEQAGELPIAVQWYAVAAQHTSSFYGQLAAMYLPADMQPAAPGAPVVSTDRRRAFEQAELTRLVHLLGQIGADQTLRTFIAHLSQRYSDPAFLALTAELATDIGRIDLAVYASRQAIKNGVVTLDGYPVLPLTQSRIADLTIVHGLIRQESGFDIDAISRAGARGLMQLMPATARAVSGWENISYRSASLTTDIDYNTRLGSAYLRDLLQKFDNVLPMALAGYNAGPHRVEQWVDRFGDPRNMEFEDVIDWMESIPFHETRDYVQRVIENITVYRQRIAGRTVPISFVAEIN